MLAQLVLMGLVAAAQSATGPTENYCWDDPILQVKGRFLDFLKSELGVKQIRDVRDQQDDRDLKDLQAEFGSATIIDFKTIHCELAVREGEESQVQKESSQAEVKKQEGDQVVAYAALSRLIRLEDSKIVWQAVCRFPEEAETARDREEFPDTNSELMRREATKEAVDNCVQQLLAQFFGKKSPQR